MVTRKHWHGGREAGMSAGQVQVCRIAGAVVLVLLAFIVYWPCLHGPFLWDDKDWTLDAQWLFQDWKGLKLIWLEPRSLQQYYPLTATSFWIDYQLWGFDTLPYHVENALLHAASAVLFWALLSQLGLRGGWMAAALFVCHPVMVESVAWITERKNVLSQALVLSALLAFARFAQGWSQEQNSRQWRWWWLALLLFFGALMAKVTAFILPPTLLVLAWWKRGRLLGRDVRPVLPFFLLAVAAGLGVAWLEVHHVGAKGAEFTMSFAERAVLAGQTPWFYLGKLLWPHPVCAIYDRWEVDPKSALPWLGMTGIVLIFGVLAWQFKRGRRRGVIASALLFAGMLFPVMGFMNVYGMRFSWVADRWVYMPALVVFAGAGYVLGGLAIARVRLGIFALLLVACLVLSRRQTACYESIDAFWLAIIQCNASPWKAHNDFSRDLMHEGRNEEAVTHAREAARINPGYAHAHGNLGSALLKLGRNDEAITSLQQAIELEPDDPLSRHVLAAALRARGDWGDAEHSLRRAIELRPDFFAARFDLGNMLFEGGRFDEAEEQFKEALALRPDHANVMNSLGSAAYRRGRVEEAVAWVKRALAIDPDLVAALSNGALILATTTDDALRDPATAVEMARRADRLSSHQSADVLIVLVAALARDGMFQQAAEAANQGASLAQAQGDTQLAEWFRRAIQTCSQHQFPL